MQLFYFVGFSHQAKASKVGHSHEVNKRAVLAARNIGVGFQGLSKFAGVMNIPQPMSKNA